MFRCIVVAVLMVASVMARAERLSAPARLADVPDVKYEPRHPRVGARLELRVDLLRWALEGRGQTTGAARRVPLGGFGLTPTVWQGPSGATDLVQQVRWSVAGDEAVDFMPALVLWPGQEWCSAERDAAPDERLRFEPLGLPTGDGSVEAAQVFSSGESRILKRASPPAAVASRESQWDLALAAGRSRLCFRAGARGLVVGEPRVLGPERQPASPHWMVLVIIDALRDDLVERQELTQSMPALAEFVRNGRYFTSAVSPGCHTRAAVSPILTGRDVMRIDPLRPDPPQLWVRIVPPELVYARGNLSIFDQLQSEGYRAVLLGNNRFLVDSPDFSRGFMRNSISTGTGDTVQSLGGVLERYADERTAMLYYVSTPHAQSATPRRAYVEARCGELTERDELTCAYRLRARLADQGLAGLRDALEDFGLLHDTLLAVTSDHGERLLEAPHEEVRLLKTWIPMDRGHGFGCYPQEVNVPLLLSGPGIAPQSLTRTVSTLDLVPTLLGLLGLRPASRLDGADLSSEDDAAAPARPAMTYGYCTQRLAEGERYSLWWRPKCAERRDADGQPVRARLELWQGDRQRGTDLTAPAWAQVQRQRMQDWLAARLPRTALMLDTSALPPALVTVRAIEGRIVDFGPSRWRYGLAGIVPRLAADERSLELDVRGYRGLFFVATEPWDASVTIEAKGLDGHVFDGVIRVGPWQIPVAPGQRPLSPAREAAWLVSASKPTNAEASRSGTLSAWWQPLQPSDPAAAQAGLSDIDRVLREWGYVR